MAWKVKFAPRAGKTLDKLAPDIRTKILRYMYRKVQPLSDPRLLGKPLRGELSGFWRYRVEDYRIICKIDSGMLTVLVVKIGPRRDVYE